MPAEAQHDLLSGSLDDKVDDKLMTLQTEIIKKYGIETQFRNLGFHPKYPFLHLFKLTGQGTFPVELLQFLWYICHMYLIGIKAHTGFLYNHLDNLGKIPYSKNFNKFMMWFLLERKTQDRAQRI